MSQTDKIRIKCFLGEEIRILNVPKNTSHEQLLQRLEADFGCPVQVTQYEDHEGDKVTVSSKSDLQEAFSVYEELRTINPSKIITLKMFLRQSSSSIPPPQAPTSNSNPTTSPPASNVMYVPTPTSVPSSEPDVPDRPQHLYSRTPPRSSPLFTITPPGTAYPDYTPSPSKHTPPPRTLSNPPPLRTPPPTPPESPRDQIAPPYHHPNGTPNNLPAKGDFSAYMHPVDQPPLPQRAPNPEFTPEDDGFADSTRPRSASRFQAEIQYANPDKPKLTELPAPKSPLLLANPTPAPATPPPKDYGVVPEHDDPFSGMGWQKGQLIGRGGYGSVYLGLNKATGELIAVKQVELDNEDDPKFKDTMLNYNKEIELMRTLNHENIVRYIGSEYHHPFFNIFLEYMPGGSISALLAKFGPFPEPVVRLYTKQILHGLLYLHTNHIVHRDIKGANILVDTKSNVKLADFGCSKIFAGIKSHFRTVLGTPFWMAPEVIKQTGHGRPADIWSLGCVIIEMSSGHPPFSQFSEVAAAMFHIASSQEPPEIPSQLSPEAHDFLLQCFQRDPKDRPDAQALLKHPFIRSVDQPQQPQPFTQELIANFGPQSRPRKSSVPFFSSKGIFVALPISIAQYIIRLLPGEDVARLSQVCKYFKAACEDDTLWRSLAAQVHWRRHSVSTPWRNVYADLYAKKKIWLDNKYTSSHLKLHSKPINCLKLLDNTLVSGGDDKKVKMWDVRKSKNTLSLKGHSGVISGVDIDREGRRIFSGSADQTIRVWNVKTKKSVRTLSGHGGAVTSVVLYGDDETKLLSSADKAIQMWDIETGSSLATLLGHSGIVYSVKYDGTTALSASADHTLKLLDLRTSTCIRTLEGHTDEVTCCQISRDSIVSGSGDGTLREWEVGTGRYVQIFDGHRDWVWSVQFDQTKIVSCGKDKQIRLWDWSTGTCAKTLQGHTDTILTLQVDETRIVSAGKDKMIKIWVPEKLSTPTTLTSSRESKSKRSSNSFPFGFGLAKQHSHSEDEGNKSSV